MGPAKFVHLSLKSAFSLAEGAIHLKDIASFARNERMPAVAITDTNNLFGALEFAETMKKGGVQPIIGCALSLKTPYFKPTRHTAAEKTFPVHLIAQSKTGYLNLLEIVSRAHLESGDTGEPFQDLEGLQGKTDDLLLLTGGAEGPLGALLVDSRLEEAEELAKDLKALFPGRMYIEIQRHGMEEEKISEEGFLNLAYDLDIPLVATNNAHFIEEDMYRAHDALLCIAAGTYVAEADRRRLTPEHRLKTAKEMQRLFIDLPEALENTIHIAKRCSFAPETHAPILPNFTGEEALSEADMLKKQAEKGLEKHLNAHVYKGLESDAEKEDIAKPYWERLAFELNVINKMGFPGYFLIVADFIQWAKDHDIPVGPGRGSGAGSVVAWALRITDLDPLRFGLLFERFLNPERVSMPDFDIDFCQEKRDQVITYVQDKYGANNVAQIITFGTLNARGVMRDVGRVLQQPYPVTDRLCKMIPNNPANATTLREALESEPRLKAEYDSDELTKAVIDRALQLEGLNRHASTHAAGVVIGDRPLHQLIPLYRDPRSTMPVTGFSMKWAEKAGLVKFDFLGLKTLTVLRQAVEFIRQSGVEVSLDTLPLDDEKTYELIARGDTAGVFQLEGSGMRSSLRSLKPDKFEDIIAMVALYRPGPMDNIPKYINRKHGLEPPDYMHDWLEEILTETHGVIIYQEQVMQIAQILAGYSLGEADLLRRAMGKKIQAEMDAQRKRFVDGAKEKGVSEGKASHIFDLVNKFAGYGFNKSHAAAYALVAYQTAYFKANYPVEFMAATLSLERDNTDKLNMLIKEVRAMKIPLYPPDINASEANFTVEGEGDEKGIRYALAAVKNVGVKAMESIVHERQENGLFQNVYEVMERIELTAINKRQMENLVYAGVFDSLNDNRAQTLGGLDMLLKHAHACHEAKTSNQVNLFAGDEESPVPRMPLPDVDMWDPTQALKFERDAIGFYFTSHPLEAYSEILAKRAVRYSDEMFSNASLVGQTVKAAGIVEDLQERRAAKSGRAFAFLGLSDPTGSYEALVFGDTLNNIRAALEDDLPLLLDISIDKADNDDTPRLIVRGFELFDPERLARNAEMTIAIDDHAALGTIKTLLEKHKGGRGVVTLSILTPEEEREVRIKLSDPIRVTPVLQGAIKSFPGVSDARIIYR